MGHFSILGRPLAPRPAFLPFLAPLPEAGRRPVPRGPQWVGEVCPVQADTWLPLLPHTALLSTLYFYVHYCPFLGGFFFPHSFPRKKTDQIPPGKAISSPPELVHGGNAAK